MSKKLLRSRAAAYLRQDGRCVYCNHPMWDDNPQDFARHHGLRLRCVWRYQLTAEHLTARQDGGQDDPSNIAAACAFCNLQRHRRKPAPCPSEFTSIVQNLSRCGKWHDHCTKRGLSNQL